MKSANLPGLLLLLPLALFTGCAKPAPAPAPAPNPAPAKHEHHPLHGGTPVVLGDESYHLELVLDAASGRLPAYVFDGELENFVRSSMPSFEIVAMINGEEKTLVLHAVPNPATGETVGDTSLFEVQADWLKTIKTFDAVVPSVTIRGTTFSDVDFNFPQGNDKD
jgi:hypothetical protein